MALEYLADRRTCRHKYRPAPDAEFGKLRLLEIGVDPYIVGGLQGHHLLARLKIVAWVDVAAADDAVDFRVDRNNSSN